MQPVGRKPIKAPEPPKPAISNNPPPKPSSSKMLAPRPSSSIKKSTEVAPQNRSLDKKGSIHISKPTTMTSVSKIPPRVPLRNAKATALQKK
jgi:hypothetical protein